MTVLSVSYSGTLYAQVRTLKIGANRFVVTLAMASFVLAGNGSPSIILKASEIRASCYFIFSNRNTP